MIDQTYIGAGRGDQDDNPDDFDRAEARARCRTMSTRRCPPDACSGLPCARFEVSEAESSRRWPRPVVDGTGTRAVRFVLVHWLMSLGPDGCAQWATAARVARMHGRVQRIMREGARR